MFGYLRILRPDRKVPFNGCLQVALLTPLRCQCADAVIRRGPGSTSRTATSPREKLSQEWYSLPVSPRMKKATRLIVFLDSITPRNGGGFTGESEDSRFDRQ